MTRAHALQAARVGFVLLAVGCAWWGFHGRWTEIVETIGRVGPARLVGGVGCALAGLVLTGALWRRLLAALGSPVEPRRAASVFFVGQLGKYIPGSVWSFAAQAQLGRRHGVPARTSVTASTMFLLVHTASGLLVGGALAAGGAVGTDIDRAWWLLVAVCGGACMAPPVVRLLGDRLAGAGVRTVYTVGDLGRSSALLAGVWACYGGCLWLLVPSAASHPADLVTATAVFALAHAAGVLLVLAPAGLGAREAVIIALLAPAVGVPAAAAAALLARVAHSVADFVLAAGAAAWARRAGTPEVVGAGHP